MEAIVVGFVVGVCVCPEPLAVWALIMIRSSEICK